MSSPTVDFEPPQLSIGDARVVYVLGVKVVLNEIHNAALIRVFIWTF